MVLFCQLDVTGRSESDPAAESVVRNILRYIAEWKPGSRRKAVYVGDSAGGTYLASMGALARPYDQAPLRKDEVLVLGPGAERAVAGNAADLADFLKAGGNLLAIGLDPDAVSALLPLKVTMNKAEHIASYFEPFGLNSMLAGIGPADVHNRDPRELWLVASGAEIFGDGVLAKAGNAVFVQMAPWQFERGQQSNLKRTFRHASVLLNRLLAKM